MSLETFDKAVDTKKSASGVVVSGGKARFKIPMNEYFKRLEVAGEGIWIYFSDVSEAAAKPNVYNIYSIDAISKSIELDKHSEIAIHTLPVFKLYALNGNETLLRAEARYKKGEFSVPHDNVAVRIYGGDKFVQKIQNPFYILKDYESRGLSLNYDRLSVTYMHTMIKPWFYISEYRYAIDGEIFKIVGYIEHNLYTEYKDRRYAVYFFADGTRRLYFGEMGYEYGEQNFPLSWLEQFNRVENIKEILQYENMILDEARRNKEDKDKIKFFKTSMEHIKYVLSASKKELEKEFETYKQNVPSLKVKE